MKQLEVIVRFVYRAPTTADDLFRDVAGHTDGARDTIVRKVDRTTVNDVVLNVIDVAVHDVATALERANDTDDKDIAAD